MSTENVNNRRFNGFDPKEPELVGLTDCVDAITDRATAVLTMLKIKFISDEDALIWSALDSIDQEVRDIKAAMNCYYDFQRLQEVSESEKDESPAK